MLKTALLIGAATLSAPAFAQDASPPARQPMTTAPAPAQSAPIPGAPVMDSTPAEDTTTSVPPATPQETAPTATSAAPADAAAPASAEKVTGKNQIAQVVETEFPTYDKNADTSLNRTEFGAWMVALKTASDPKTKASDPATVKWIDGAFASADTDKSKAVSKAELTTYLAKDSG